MLEVVVVDTAACFFERYERVREIFEGFFRQGHKYAVSGPLQPGLDDVFGVAEHGKDAVVNLVDFDVRLHAPDSGWVNIDRVNFGFALGFGDDYAKATDARKHVDNCLAALNEACDACVLMGKSG